MSDLNFRSATADDVDAVVALVESAYRGEASLAGWTTEAQLIDGQRTDAAAIAALISAPDTRLLLADREASLVACCELRRLAGQDVCYFGTFSVNPRQQGHGIGGLVLSKAERIARDELGAATMEMTVIRQRDDLIAWYERRGYLRTGELRPFPYGEERFGRPKVDDLEFAVLRKQLGSPNQQ